MEGRVPPSNDADQKASSSSARLETRADSARSLPVPRVDWEREFGRTAAGDGRAGPGVIGSRIACGGGKPSQGLRPRWRLVRTLEAEDPVCDLRGSASAVAVFPHHKIRPRCHRTLIDIGHFVAISVSGNASELTSACNTGSRILEPPAVAFYNAAFGS